MTARTRETPPPGWREVHRDDALRVVDKDAGLAVQGEDGDPDALYPRLGSTEAYLGLHHRLDQAASGLVLFTRHPSANAAIAEAFRDHDAARTYLAVLAGDGLDVGEEATWEAPLDGKPAVSHVRCVHAGAGLRAAILTLETGRTHQLRRHAALAGLPLVGDRRYGMEVGGWWPRLALHAARLSVTHPWSGARLTWTAPLPADLSALWAMAGGTDDPAAVLDAWTPVVAPRREALAEDVGPAADASPKDDDPDRPEREASEPG